MNYYFTVIWGLIIEQLRGIYVAQIELLLIVGALVILIPGYILMRIKGNITKRGLFTAYFLFVYVGIMLLITIFRRQPGSKEGQIVTHLDFGYIKGGWFRQKQAAYSILNVFLFVPFGFLIRVLRKEEGHIRNIVMCTLLSFLFSFGIECIQLMTGTGSFEVTDLVTNLSGGFIGAIIASLILHILDRRILKHEKEI
ncbi:VanZ family protein [Butyrivibrio sp. INlla14]|uniref:VanZ family protein n=1 Tax=Butyrivibrio sp. INlla14 TaxID=1520808 RepID=UPI000876D191|nr:VanZ family protein [Butyrivibrio sp. INlla14]SCY00849.1 VanZ like family protein [Butyrivibrio sp. INlla14]